ncbi:oxidoreductase-like protein [Fimicolochytrium jonesii]|uniref:oxidoreductase-like protein n=1 Tax=Fimicolochytrium jonesii TaxID=1396493 RepID=UPI0022FDF0FE|nr:oxidoreductase-like protein [Fimicolochytrium jonesii]KAI8815961.1 oxidoreductase-like protein [Fimicolochytrium jonesii]
MRTFHHRSHLTPLPSLLPPLAPTHVRSQPHRASLPPPASCHPAFSTSTRARHDHDGSYPSHRYKGYWELILKQPHSYQFDPTTLPQAQAAHRNTHTHTTPTPTAIVSDTSPLSFMPGRSNAAPPAAKIFTPLTSVEASSAEELARLEAEEKALHPPAAPDNCCMSGCVHCVWDVYQADMEAFQLTRNRIRDRRRNLLIASGREQEAAQAAAEATAADADLDAAGGGMDPGMAAFLAMEKDMLRRQREREVELVEGKSGTGVGL